MYRAAGMDAAQIETKVLEVLNVAVVGKWAGDVSTCATRITPYRSMGCKLGFTFS
jgi:hypothetical protein